MSKSVRFVPALAGLLMSVVASATTITENFTSNPLQNGWQIFGNAGQFHWNSSNHNVEITWDSTNSNSYLFHPLGTVLSRSDDFRIEFDLLLNDAISGIETGKTGGLELGIGLLNLAKATSTNFMRGAFGDAPSLAEFNYFPHGYYEFGGTIYDAPATTTPTFISTNSFTYAPTVYAPYSFELPTNVVIHISLAYAASNQTLVTSLTTNGVAMFQPPDVVLTDPNTSAFTDSDDYRVDAFSISSYSSVGDDYDSILAHGTVDNVSLTFPHPVENLTGNFSNSVWQTQFLSRSNWVYNLERTPDLVSWSSVSPAIYGTGTNLLLQDTNPPAESSLYRVRAVRP